jgi:uncharacterized protein Usg
MSGLKLQMNTNDMIINHLLQRFIYQYYSLFSKFKDHPAIKEFTQLWFIKLFVDNSYFKHLPQSVLIDYEIKENKDLYIVVRAPLHYKSYLVSLEKEINTCVTLTDNQGATENLNIFSIEYEL